MKGSSVRLFLGLIALSVSLTAVAQPARRNAVQRSPRVRIRIDADWRFRRDAKPARGSEFVWTTRSASVTTLDLAKLPTDLDQGDWQPTKLGNDVFHGRPGFAWYRTTVPVISARGDGPLALHFEGIDDNASVYLNGVKLVTHEGWDEPFDVSLDSVWKMDGPNELVVLVQNTNGQGGIYGQASVRRIQPEAVPAESGLTFDDHGWQRVHLPHDYVVDGPFDEAAATGHGSLPVMPAWYRKTLTLRAQDRGKSIWIDFDGVFRDSTVYLNGHKLGNWPSGYAPVRYDIAKFAVFGGRNLLAVHVDPRRFEGWWYEGGGIYRHVWLNIADPVHVRPWGTFVQSAVLGPEGQANPDADLTIATGVDNKGSMPQIVQVTSRIVGPNGRTAASVTSSRTLGGGATADISQTASLRKAVVWSIENPKMYRLITTIRLGRKVVDQVETSFGIRTIRFDKDRGFFLNGKHVELKGTCNHQDFAGVGIGMPDGLLEWRIRKLKEMGSNAYRCSHNPPAAELLDACDRLGMVVMDETRHLGDVETAKTPRTAKADDLSELRRLILRDRNHPSVIMWSMENEEPIQGTPEGAALFTAMRNVTRELDPNRPVTAAMNGGWGRGLSRVEDLLGMNYGVAFYDRVRAEMPEIPMFGSETASAVATRGIYSNDKTRGYVAAYDTQTPGSYAATAEAAWKPIAERPWMAGGFVWTGFDYKGEPSPYGWPCINSHFGIMDMCGFPKDSYYYYQAWWGSKPVVHVFPHWNWRGSNGHPIPVWVFSNADEVELFLNGRTQGRKKMPRNSHLEWTVPYEPGALEARGYRGGLVIGKDRVETTGAPSALRLKPARLRLLPDQEDLVPVEVEVIDSKGRVVPTAQGQINFSTAGHARVVGVGNGDPSSHEPDKASARRAFNGLCMALVGDATRPGTVTLTATSPGLRSARVVLTASAVRAPVRPVPWFRRAMR